MEIWKDIEGYEGLYQVSNKGRAKRLQSKGCKQERILTPVKNRCGYLRVTLCKDGQRRIYSVHRLVVQTFLPNPDNLPQVNHIDENKTNNTISNLEWCTNEYNCNHDTHNERSAKTKSKPVLGISLDKKIYLYFNRTMDAERLAGFKNGAISKCCRGKLKTHKGYTWMYADSQE